MLQASLVALVWIASGISFDKGEALTISIEIFKEPISIFVDKPDPADPSTSPTDLSVFLSAKERPRYTIKTGTEAGHAEGSAFASAQFRNIFGGAESLNLHGSLGTRTRSAYSGNFETPLLSNPGFRIELGGLASSTLKSWASHDEAVKGGSTKLKWRSALGSRHELGYSGIWRQITGLAENASPTVRHDAGDSFKSSVTYSFTHDTRDVPLLPSSGVLFKTTAELAGVGPLKGDVGFFKPEAEFQAAIPLVSKSSGISFVTGLRAGLLYPLPVGGETTPTMSRINDRFQLGGPTDVRGFRLSGLGPRDGPDSVGGDVYAAGSAAVLFPFPRSGPETPLRFQAFINAGRLVALRRRSKSQMTSQDVQRSVSRAVQSLTDAPPSCSAGVGIVYAHPVARFELNFSLPLIVWEGDQARKGVSFGVGMSFM